MGMRNFPLILNGPPVAFLVTLALYDRGRDLGAAFGLGGVDTRRVLALSKGALKRRLVFLEVRSGPGTDLARRELLTADSLALLKLGLAGAACPL